MSSCKFHINFRVFQRVFFNILLPPKNWEIMIQLNYRSYLLKSWALETYLFTPSRHEVTWLSDPQQETVNSTAECDARFQPNGSLKKTRCYPL